MTDLLRTRKQLHQEIAALRRRIGELERSEYAFDPAGQQGLPEMEGKYRSIFENATEGIFLCSSDGCLLDANPALAHILGYESPEDLTASLTHRGEQFFADREVYQDYLRLITGKRTVDAFEMRVRKKDGDICWLSVSSRLITDGSGKPMRIEGFVTDITEQRNLREELVNIVRQQDAILDTANVAISLVRDRKQVWINRKTEEMFQYPKEDLVNQTTRKLYPSQEAYERLGTDAYPVLSRGLIYETVQELVRRDGSHIWVKYNGRAIDPPDLAVGTLWILEDITERKSMEEALQRANEDLGGRVADRTETLMRVNEELRTEIEVRQRAEGALRKSEERFRRIVEAAREGIWSMNGERRTTFVNSHMAAMLGYEPEEMLGRPVEDFMLKEDMADHSTLERTGTTLRHSRRSGISHRVRRTDMGCADHLFQGDWDFWRGGREAARESGRRHRICYGQLRTGAAEQFGPPREREAGDTAPAGPEDGSHRHPRRRHCP
jgi:PAS domain S-box-containing protein